MEDKFDFFKIVLIVLVWTISFYLLGWVCGWIIGKKNHNIPDIKIETPSIIDSIKPKLDSIEYNIIIKDSIIYNIKEEMKNEVDKIQHITDSASVNEFYKLVSE